MESHSIWPATSDLCDAHGEAVKVVSPALGLRGMGRRERFAGTIATVKVFEDNSLVRAALEEPGGGRVLVVDGGGSLRCALVGGQLAQLAAQNGWAGLVVNGCVRDAAEIDACDIGVRALATNPRKSTKRGAGEREVAVTFGEVTFSPGHWLCADEDGVIVAAQALV